MLQDLVHSFRALLKRPGFSILAVLTIALGVGVNTAMFTIVNCVLWKPFPYVESERLVRFSESSPSGMLNNSGPNSQEWKSRSQALDSIALYRFFPPLTLHLPERDRSATVAYCHPDLFQVLRIQPVLGKLFNDADDKTGAQAVAVITDSAWTKYFGRDPGIVGKPLKVAMNGSDSLMITGVLPPGFDYDTVEFWLPLGRFPMAPDSMRANHWFAGIGRLNPGISLARARKDLTTVSTALEQEFPQTNKGVRVVVDSMADYYASRIKTPLYILFWAVGFVMLIACGNVVHLVLTRTLSRGREMAVRMAMGARSPRLTWLLLSEGLILSIAGGALGVLAAQWAVTAAIKAQPGLLPTFRTVQLDAEAVIYAIGATLFTALLLALFPVWRVTRTTVRDALQAAGRSQTDGRKQAAGWFMIAGEIAMASVLLVGAGLMIQALRNLSRVDVGYNPSGLISLAIGVPPGKQLNEESDRALLRQLQDGTRSIPGYRASALAGQFAVGGNGMLGPLVIPGRSNPSTPPLIPAMNVSSDFFETMRIPFKLGRTFSATATKVPEIVVNEEFVRRFLPDENPIGRRVSMWEPADIVGVVANSRLQGNLADVKPEVYMPGVHAAGELTILLRVDGASDTAGTALRESVKAVDPRMRLGTPRTLVSREAARTVVERFTRSLLTLFAVLAMVLACLGIYGVASYSVAQRIREIGIRMALGASRASVTKLILGRTIAAAALGAAVGIAGAAGLSRFIKSFLFDVTLWDPIVLGGSLLALILVAILASVAPTVRASNVDPAICLRQD